MRILKYNDKLVEEVGHVDNHKVVFLRYVKDCDKDKCECGRVIERDIDIVEGCLNWKERVTGVDTIPTPPSSSDKTSQND